MRMRTRVKKGPQHNAFINLSGVGMSMLGE